MLKKEVTGLVKSSFLEIFCLILKAVESLMDSLKSYQLPPIDPRLYKQFKTSLLFLNFYIVSGDLIFHALPELFPPFCLSLFKL